MIHDSFAPRTPPISYALPITGAWHLWLELFVLPTSNKGRLVPNGSKIPSTSDIRPRPFRLAVQVMPERAA